MHTVHVTLPTARLAALLGAALTAACAADPGELGAPGASGQEIINGTLVSAEGSGYVALVASSLIRSGMLIRNSWVLTADLQLDATANRVPLRVVMGSQSVYADQIVNELGYTLVHLATPMTMRGSTTGWRVDLWPGATGSLLNTTLTCYGYGRGTATGGGGLLRRAQFTVDALWYKGYYVRTPLGGPMMGEGDQGGPCFSGGYLTGLQSYSGIYTGGTPPDLALQYSAESFREWVLDTLGERPTPRNDTRATALYVVNSTGRYPLERTVAGTTVGATHDGPSGACGCTSGADVWYQIHLPERAAVALDTAGSEFDTSVTLTNAAGTPLADGCNDDSYCTTGGFTSGYQSQVAMVLDPGWYYAVVGGCGAGRFFLHYQSMQLPGGASSPGLARVAANAFTPRLTGAGAASGTLSGTNYSSSACGGDAAGEDMRWFLSCGDQPQVFSLCRSDGGSYTRQAGSTLYDPALYMVSARYSGVYVYNGSYPDTNGVASGCNDDAIRAAGDDCTGTGGDLQQYGSRLRNIPSARGINAIFVDNRGSSLGMGYTLAYSIR